MAQILKTISQIVYKKYKEINSSNENIKWTRDYLNHLETGKNQPQPHNMVIMLNEYCNLRCEFCELWKFDKEIDVNKVYELLDDAKKINIKAIVFTGGEPLLYPYVFDVIRYAKKLGFGTNITTNGIFVKQKINELLDSGIDSISISIDGLEETHDNIRGIKGSFTRAYESLRKLTEYPQIKTMIYFVVTNKNVYDLKKVYELSKELGVEFNFWVVNGVPHLYLKKDEDIKEYLSFIDEMIETNPHVRKWKDYYYEAINYHNGKLRVRCMAMTRQLGIDAHGNVIPCCVWKDPSLVVNNINNNSLLDIWNSKEAFDMRKNIFNNGCENKCYNHYIAEFTEVTKMPFLLEK